VNFRPEMVERILAGEKTQTRRLVSDNPRSPWWKERCSLKQGRSYAVCPGRGKRAVARVRIAGVRREPLAWINDIGARAEGFRDRQHFVDYWKRLHGGWDLSAIVWVVSFKLEEAA
jgi:hypothetical protein